MRSAPDPSETLLRVRSLSVEISSDRGVVHAVRNVSFDVRAGEHLGVVGESGCGKTTLVRALLGLLPAGASIVEGQVLLDGVDLTALPARALREARGTLIGMIFQDPMTALNPVMSVGEQIAEGPRLRLGESRAGARKTALALMSAVGIPDPARRFRSYPHELSGGMRQRVVIAIALACRPRLLLCDEPTTALDVTIQDQILVLLDELSAEVGAGMVYISHDLAVVAQTCRRVAVMYAGQLVEQGPVADVFREPRHPYTLGLLESMPDPAIVRGRLRPIPGSPPDLAAPPNGCPFHPRCRYRKEDCDDGEFPLLAISHERESACRYHELLADPTLLVAR